jgi:hypothetical protein
MVSACEGSFERMGRIGHHRRASRVRLAMPSAGHSGEDGEWRAARGKVGTHVHDDPVRSSRFCNGHLSPDL